MTYRKATHDEIYAHKVAGGVYPLHAIIQNKSGQEIKLEDLRCSWSRPDPQWEILAPAGYHFSLSMTHSMLSQTIAEAKIAADEPLAKCCPGCGCGCGLDSN